MSRPLRAHGKGKPFAIYCVRSQLSNELLVRTKPKCGLRYKTPQPLVVRDVVAVRDSVQTP